MNGLKGGLIGLIFPILLLSGCNGRIYFGANDPKLNQNQNKQMIEQRIEEDSRISPYNDNRCEPLPIISYKF